MNAAFSCDIRYQFDIFNKQKQALYLPILEAIVMNKHGEELGAGIYEKFLIDTGASVSILKGKYEKIFKYSDHIDSFKVQYGSGNAKMLSIYEAKLKIKGVQQAIPLKVGIDPSLSFSKYSLLGNADFLEKFKAIAIINSRKKVKFYSY